MNRQERDEIKNSIIGLGKNSFVKSYYPELQRKISELEDVKLKYRQLLRLSTSGFLAMDLQGHILEVNSKMTEMVGYDSSEAILGSSFLSFIPKKYHAENLNSLQICLEEEKMTHFETVLLRKISGEFPVEIIAYKITQNHESRIISLVEDISQRKQSETDLLQSEERFKHIFEQANDGLVVIQNFKIVKKNPAAVEITGLKDENVDVRKVLEMLNPKDKIKILKNFLDFSNQQGFSTNLRTSFLHPVHREEVDVDISFSKLEWQGKPALIGLIRDITKQTQLEKQVAQAQKMESIGTLAGGVAHDFNNILTVISGYTEMLLRDSKMPEGYKSALIQVAEASRRANSLTSQLLAFSRKQMLKPQKVDLNTVVSNLMKMLQRLIGENIHLEVHLSSDLKNIWADSGQLDQIIMNLIVNAHDAMEDGGNIYIRTRNVNIDEKYRSSLMESRPGDYVCLTIEDTGIGIPKDIQQQVFEPFFTTKKMGKGTGLGLSVVYGAVQQQNGWINLYSEEGIGTTFKIFFPVHECEKKEKSIIQNPEADFMLQGSGELILIVEDEAYVLRLAKKILSKAGFRTLEAPSAQKAKELFREHFDEIKLVFSDVVLPDQNGVELIQEFMEEKRNLRFLLSSGYADSKSKWDIINENRYPFINKPYSVEDLLFQIIQLLQ